MVNNKEQMEKTSYSKLESFTDCGGGGGRGGGKEGGGGESS